LVVELFLVFWTFERRRGLVAVWLIGGCILGRS
jgi:hypothetical protein